MVNLAWLVLVAMLGLDIRAATAVDVTGHWRLQMAGSDEPLSLSVEQRGNAVVFDVDRPPGQLGLLPAEGEIRPDGTFAVGAYPGNGPGNCSRLWLDGVATPDGTSMSGNGGWTAGPVITSRCPVSSFTFTATRTLCGNGALDAGEECDQCPGGCDDDNACTVEVTCVPGVCERYAILCNDGARCTTDGCSAGVCQHTPFADATLFDDTWSRLVALLESRACEGGVIRASLARRLRKTLTKARERVARSLQAPQTELFERLLAKADRLIESAERTIARPRPRPLACGAQLQADLNDLRQCVAGLPRPSTLVP